MSIGFTLPFNFNTSDELLTQIKSDFINLVSTKKGERPMNLEFGCDIHNIIFEPNDEELYLEALRTVEDAIAEHMSYIQLEAFEIDTTSEDIDRHKAKVYIRYNLKESPNLSGEALLQL